MAYFVNVQCYLFLLFVLVISFICVVRRIEVAEIVSA